MSEILKCKCGAMTDPSIHTVSGQTFVSCIKPCCYNMARAATRKEAIALWNAAMSDKPTQGEWVKNEGFLNEGKQGYYWHLWKTGGMTCHYLPAPCEVLHTATHIMKYTGELPDPPAIEKDPTFEEQITIIQRVAMLEGRIAGESRELRLLQSKLESLIERLGG